MKCMGRMHYGLVMSLHLSVCLHVSNQELLEGKERNLAWLLYHRGTALLNILRSVVMKYWIGEFVRWDPQ
jgi:hypothetical protein